MVGDEDEAVRSLHELADVYRKHSALFAMLVVPSLNFDFTATCPGGKNRRRIGMCFCTLCRVTTIVIVEVTVMDMAANI